MSHDIAPTWSPGTLDSREPAPSVVLSLFGASSERASAVPHTDDQVFELLNDSGRRRGWSAHGECYDAGLTQSTGLDRTVVVWCHVGVHLQSAATTLLSELAASLEDVMHQLGAIDLVGLQATLDLGDRWWGTSQRAAAPDRAAHLGPTARVVAAPAVNDASGSQTDPARMGGVDLSEVSAANVIHHLRGLRASADVTPLGAVERWAATDLGAAAGAVADDLARSGRVGEYRITLIDARP